MIPVLKKHIDQVIEDYSNGDYYNNLKKAKEDYFSKTGRINEEDDDYEGRMASFNFWYVLEYKNGPDDLTIMNRYLEENQVDSKIRSAFEDHKHSLFEFTGTNFRGQFTFKDILYNTKMSLAKDHDPLSLLKDDLFLGRVLFYEGRPYLMNGLCIIPKEALSNLKKEAKKVRKKGCPDAFREYLFQVEALKSKWRQYGHLEVSKVFVFNS